MVRTDYSLLSGFDPVILSFPGKDSLEAQIGRFFAARRSRSLQPSGHDALIYALALEVNRQPRVLGLRRNHWDIEDIREYLLGADEKKGLVDWSKPGETCFVLTCDSFFQSQPEQAQIVDEINDKSPGFSEDENLEAFLAELPRLLEEKLGQYALIIDGEVVRTDPDESALLEYVYTEFPDAEGLIQPIQETLPGAGSKARSIEEAEQADEERRHETQKKNLEAFLKMLPQLLKEHKSQHALIVNGKLERIDADLQSIIDYAYSRFPNTLSLIQPIQEKLPRVHMGSPKLLAR